MLIVSVMIAIINEDYRYRCAVNVTVEMILYHPSLLHGRVAFGDVLFRCLAIVISYYCAIIRAYNCDRIITIVKRGDDGPGRNWNYVTLDGGSSRHCTTKQMNYVTLCISFTCSLLCA